MSGFCVNCCCNPCICDRLAEDPIMDEEDAVRNDYRMAAQKAMLVLKDVFVYVREAKYKALAMDCLFLALGWKDVLGAEDQVQLSKRHGCTKANISKVVRQIQQRIGTSPMPGQRDARGVRNMSRSRKKQLK